jgi:hypothetical protein
LTKLATSPDQHFEMLVTSPDQHFEMLVLRENANHLLALSRPCISLTLKREEVYLLIGRMFALGQAWMREKAKIGDARLL